MKKISWLKRLFWSWEALASYFSNINKNDDETLQKTIYELNNKITQLSTSKEYLEKSLLEKEKNLDEKTSYILRLNQEMAIIKSKLEEKEKEIFSLKENKNAFLEEKNLNEQAIENLKEKIETQKRENEHLKRDIFERLNPLNKIEKTFFGQTGNKGIGELGELQLKNILEKSGMDKEMYTENLVVNSLQVEFAIKADMNNKWIPIDSKVILGEEFDVENNIIVNESYKIKVQKQAKEITKYLSKSNTTDYGLLVLQNDKIYMSLFNSFPSFFEQMIKENKIYICSPSSFIQFAWSLSHILDIYKKVHNEEKIYDDVFSVISTVNKFSLSLSKVHKDFNIAMTTHYPTLQNKHNSLTKKLKAHDKIKDLPILNENNKDDI